MWGRGGRGRWPGSSAIRGCWPIPEALAAEVRTRPPVLLVHGDADPTLPVAATHQAALALEALGFEVATHVSPGLGHGIDEAGLRLGGQFLARTLA